MIELRSQHGLREVPPYNLTKLIHLSPLINYACADGSNRDEFLSLLRRTSDLMPVCIEKPFRGQPVVYPRDVFQQFDDIFFAEDNYTCDMTGFLNRNSVPMVLSPIGIGGKVLRSGNVVVLSEQLRGLPELELLEHKGYEVDFLPMPTRDEEDCLSVRMRNNNHIDTECNLSLQLGTPVIVVNKLYYDKYETEVRALERKYDAALVKVVNPTEQTKKRAVNFLELPNGKIIMPHGCPETTTKLRVVLGVENVIESNIDCSKISSVKGRKLSSGKIIRYFSHGGLRCMTNLVY